MFATQDEEAPYSASPDLDLLGSMAQRTAGHDPTLSSKIL